MLLSAMSSDTTISVGLIIAIIGCGIGIWNWFQAYKKNIKGEATSTGQIEAQANTEFIKINMKLDEINRVTADIKSDLKQMDNKVDKMNEELVAQKLQINALWSKLDRLAERVDEVSK